MELSRPGAELLGETEAGALRVLARVGDPISGREVARRAGGSASSTRRALERLTRAGLVQSRPSSHAVLYNANREHLLWGAVQDVLTAPARLWEELADLTQEQHRGVTLALFGSVARGEATASSDVDLLLLLPDNTHSAETEELVDALTALVQRRTGNPAQVVVLTHQQLRAMVASDDPLVASLTTDARTLAGPPLAGAIAHATRAVA